MSQPQQYAWPAMGCEWQLTIWDELPAREITRLGQQATGLAEEFEQAHSRFRPDSRLNQLAGQTGEFAVPEDFTDILEWYFLLYGPSEKRLNPLIGQTMADIGYDATYSLTAKPEIGRAPDLTSAVEILEPGRIQIKQPVQFDFGALGKGFFVDKLTDWLATQGCRRFLVNGSGDIRYVTDGPLLKVGLEDPADPTRAIGRLELASGALASSASNRRRWADRHHIIDATTTASPEVIAASWVKADRCALADALATALFSVPPARFRGFVFDYCLLDSNRHAKSSAGFKAELF
jgi:thiamine biosynthesis lipoprotein